MRTDHYIGLNERALKLVRELSCKELGEFEGAFYNRFPLHAWSHAGTVRYVEYIQDEPWASGPHFFIAFLDVRGRKVKESLWTAEEIESYL